MGNLDKRSQTLLTAIREMVRATVLGGKGGDGLGDSEIRDRVLSHRFTRADIRQATAIDQRELAARLTPLEDGEYLLVNEGGRGRRCIYSLSAMDDDLRASGLTTPDELAKRLSGKAGVAAGVEPSDQEGRPW